jgi:hypothetical protein
VCSIEQGNGIARGHRWEMMIPGQFEGSPRTVATFATPIPPPASSGIGRGPDASPPPPRRPELAGWLKVAIFAATLLAATWMVMWLDAAAR